MPKPDIRRLLVPLGPVAVFGASNFPLAFSVAGGDTASALAAGCSVVCKAHTAHPGTSELAARAIANAAAATSMPRGVFSLVHGTAHAVGITLVTHPLIRAVGFTGSLRAGRALCDAAAARPEPIPVYAEMGSINPVFILPSALQARSESIAQGLAQSITLGVGQFCTNPGVLVAVRGPALDELSAQLAQRMGVVGEGIMLYEQLGVNYAAALERAKSKGARAVGSASSATNARCARPALLVTEAESFLADSELREEMFGPVSMVVVASDVADMYRVAARGTAHCHDSRNRGRAGRA